MSTFVVYGKLANAIHGKTYPTLANVKAQLVRNYRRLEGRDAQCVFQWSSGYGFSTLYY